MKKTVIGIIAIVFAFAAPVSGQNQGGERIRTEKIAFFTRRLNLTSEEAERFWPVYNDFSNRRMKMNQERNALVKYASQNYSNLSAAELEEAGDKLIEFQLNEADLAREYHEKFKKVLPPEKVIKLYAAEVQFNTFLLNQLQDRRQQPAGRLPNR